MRHALLAVAICLLAAGPACAGVAAREADQAPPREQPAQTQPTLLPASHTDDLRHDRILLRMYEHFVGFAKEHVQRLNVHHIKSRSRMAVTRTPQGHYLGRYHEIDRESMNCQVKRSTSRKVPFVAVLNYKEQVFEAVALSEAALRQAVFTVVASIPTCEIFSYKNGNWE
jgi:hypothetical protein